MIKNNFYVITGGPGAGKTSLIRNLHGKGFKIAEENARKIIKERKNKGLTPRPEPKEFARQIFEKDFNNFMINVNEASVMFFDRSFLDSAHMIFASDKNYFAKIEKSLRANRFNRNVFIAPPWKEIYCTDEERDQTFEEAITVYERLHDWYERNGYNLIELPKDKIENCVEFVLAEISNEIITQK